MLSPPLSSRAMPPLHLSPGGWSGCTRSTGTEGRQTTTSKEHTPHGHRPSRLVLYAVKNSVSHFLPPVACGRGGFNTVYRLIL